MIALEQDVTKASDSNASTESHMNNKNSNGAVSKHTQTEDGPEKTTSWTHDSPEHRPRNSVDTQPQRSEPIASRNDGIHIKIEEAEDVDLSTISEAEPSSFYPRRAVVKTESEEYSHNGLLYGATQPQHRSPGSNPLISGPSQHTSSLNKKGSVEGSHVVASKIEGSSEVNLHSVPVYSPRPIQPASSVVGDPFLRSRPVGRRHESDNHRARNLTIETDKANAGASVISPTSRPGVGSRTQSTPNHIKSPELRVTSDQKNTNPQRLSPHKDQSNPQTPRNINGQVPSPIPSTIPLPPLSLSTYLQLELSSHRPSQSHIYRSASTEFPYESSRVKIERLLNFLFLPHQLEAVLWFGTLACLDYWLYTFTILPLRLLKSLFILAKSWSRKLLIEASYVGSSIYSGSQRMWHRRRSRRVSAIRQQLSRANSESKFIEEKSLRAKSRAVRYHRRQRSMPSTLLPEDKADLLKGLLIIFTCLILLQLDASRMYHWVRGQAAIKLYVIYNLLEVCDRLLSAIGQDVLECLFSQESLERKPDGHSKVLRPLWLFLVALIYTVIHSTALFYQVVTLNVAVNSYSNALVTLLMSNQFVEIKGTVFKKFEKENLFQLTCADIVERFQLWHMLIIIASRNIVETGGWNLGLGSLSQPSATSTTAASATNITYPFPPRSVSAIMPQAFTLLPSLVSSLSSSLPAISQVLSPFVIVLGSEMLIDWLKHAYINKFNNVRPVIYGRFLDVLAKDYYTNAFADQNLARRFGLPVIPLSCLLIRACVQTYQMFVAAWMPAPSPNAAASLTSIHQQYTASRSAMPTSTAAVIVSRVDELLYHLPSTIVNSKFPSYFTTVLVFLLVYLILLACKLVLGMLLLAYSRSRYKSMKEREKNSGHHVEGARRVGGWGTVEVDDDKRRWIYEDDPAGLRNLREREAKDHMKREQTKEKGGGVDGLDKVKRYEMVAKRIW